MIQVLSRVNEDGLYVEPVLLKKNEEKEDEKLIDVEVPQGLYRPRWNGSKWEEGLSQEEISKLHAPEPSNDPNPVLTDAMEAIVMLAEENTELRTRIEALEGGGIHG